MLKLILPSLSLLLFIFTFTSLSQAALGDRVESIANDKDVLRAASVSTDSDNPLYTVHEIVTDGNVVKEYISKEKGQVFAVTWRGVKKPDLSVLLGSYYTEFDTANKKRKRVRGRQPVAVKSSNVVVRRGGHMRDLHGRAFLPDIVPAGVDVESLP